MRVGCATGRDVLVVTSDVTTRHHGLSHQALRRALPAGGAWSSVLRGRRGFKLQLHPSLVLSGYDLSDRTGERAPGSVG